MKVDATVFIFIVILGFILVNSQWFKQEMAVVTDIFTSGIKAMQNP